MKKILITALDGYAAFQEVILSTQYALQHLGFVVEISTNGKLYKDAINIVFAGHHTSVAKILNLGIDLQNIIIYNLEQVGRDVPWMNAKYFELMRHTHVWEYSEFNFKKLSIYGMQNMHLVPIGYTPNLEVIEQLEQEDIDVFFFGSISLRRIQVLDAMRAAGINIVTTEHRQYIDKERNDLIARSKIILNVHFYDQASIFEVVRASFLLANKKAIVSELGINTAIETDIKQAIYHGSIEQLPSLCLDLLANPQKRQDLATNGYNIIKQRDSIKYIQSGMEFYLSNTHKIFHLGENKLPIPKTMNLGCGTDWKYEMFNIDNNPVHKPDLMFDINNKFMPDSTIDSWRFGKNIQMSNYFDKIQVKNVFECLNNISTAMTNCLLWLVEGGILEIKVVHSLSQYISSDPNFKRYFNENSFSYFMNMNNLIELGWYEYTFDILEFNISLSDFGLQKLDENGQIFDRIKHIPHAVDFLTFTLRKRKLTDNEKNLLW